MPIRHAAVAVLALAFVIPAYAEPLKPIRVIMIGDSTMTNKSGYGEGFCAQFKPEVTCVNLARGGRSSKSYRVEGLWDKAVGQMRDSAGFSRTYVWIGFGHNDGSSRPERHTDIKAEFPLNMRRFGDDITAARGVPVYVTPLSQRWFRDGRLRADLLPWSTAIKVVARDRGHQVVDVYAASQKAVQEMGLPAANRMAGEPIPQNILDTENSGTSVPAVFSDASQGTRSDKQAFDYTHLGPAGSAYFGKLAVDTWAAQDPGIRPYLK
ncbi:MULTISPECIES: GDSL-type esterase/lipase family protein [Asticcacaulis]|uniref:GDSL-type esterase/lipase family protein n=1 Tax=Asticcacaulis TaxID=76890 RepID=UPI001AE70118|nr:MULTISPECIES: GDSL-type esterase/lipase family protein [Asticcacaulis]MBP2159252.1 lysophospholipase L1-like esterase [Asticcacaulis solisilvae]MDR6800297.1 lysophospholipase L1-like esterase [Asticcacaulis sp. BE141]